MRANARRLLASLRAYAVIFPVCAGVFIAADDQTSVVVLLPEMLADLRVSVSELDRASWTITGYLIGYTAAIPLMGRVADRFGYRIVFAAAMAVFMAGSALVAVSPSIPGWLGGEGPSLPVTVGARVFQAIGGGAMIPVAIASVGDVMPRHRHALAFGLIGASAEAGGVIGPLWAGAITTVASWQAVFWINLPLGLAVLGALAFAPGGMRRQVRIDFVGGAVLAAALALLTAGLSRTHEADAVTAWLLAGAAALAAASVWWIARAHDPILPRGLLLRARFVASNAAHLLLGAALITAMVTVPLMSNTALGEDALDGGLKLLRMTVAIPVGAVLGGRATQRFGSWPPAAAGIALTSAGLLAMSGWSTDVADPWMTVHLATAGLGFGLLISPIISSAMRDARPDERGAASGIITVSRMAGMTVGLAALTAWGAGRYAGLTAELPPLTADPARQEALMAEAAQAGMEVFQGFFLAAAVVTALAIVPAWIMSRPGKQ